MCEDMLLRACVCMCVCSDGVGHFQRAPRRRGSLRSAVRRERHERRRGHRAFVVRKMQFFCEVVFLPGGGGDADSTDAAPPGGR